MSFSPVFNTASSQAGAIADLFMVVLAICGVILVIVASLIGVSLVRFRHYPGVGEPRPYFGNRTLEITWTVVPLVVLIWLFVLTAHGMRQSDPPAHQEPDLLVIGHQWWWEIRYPKSSVVTANEIHLPVGVQWLVRLESVDVIHDFWVPQLARKMDMVPGHPNHIWLQADRPGTYLGRCAEFCGAQHALMRFLVIAQPTVEFEAWQQQQLRPTPEPFSGAAAQGAEIFQRMTCVNCHAINGTPARAQVAPDLTHFASRQTLAAGVLANTAVNLTRWLYNPQAVKPFCLMPNLKLSDAQVANLVRYLEALQ